MTRNALKSLHEMAEAARHELMLCQLALDDAHAARPTSLLDKIVPALKPIRAWKLHRARRHRAAARDLIERLHATLHDRASLGRHNADLWVAIMRGVDALLMSRWLNAHALAAPAVAPARAPGHIMLGDLAELLGHLHELQWPGEAPSESSPPTSS